MCWAQPCSCETGDRFAYIPGYAAALVYRDAPRPLRSSPVMTATEILSRLESL
jgi:hypothetical protein